VAHYSERVKELACYVWGRMVTASWETAGFSKTRGTTCIVGCRNWNFNIQSSELINSFNNCNSVRTQRLEISKFEKKIL